VYLHRLHREIAAARTSLDHVDVLVLTGGVAEHESGLRTELLEGLSHLGFVVDPRPDHGSEDRVISPPTARTRVLVVESREDLEIVYQIASSRESRRREPLCRWDCRSSGASVVLGPVR